MGELWSWVPSVTGGARSTEGLWDRGLGASLIFNRFISYNEFHPF